MILLQTCKIKSGVRLFRHTLIAVTTQLQAKM
jgi:hypothetical protein